MAVFFEASLRKTEWNQRVEKHLRSSAQRSLVTEMNQSKDKKVLLLEDDADICKLLEMSFREFEFISTDTPQGALAIYNEQKPDLIITDLMTPGGGGIAFMRFLKAQKCRVPIIAMSGAEIEPHVLARLYGVRHFLKKPFEMDELRRLMHAELQNFNLDLTGEV